MTITSVSSFLYLHDFQDYIIATWSQFSEGGNTFLSYRIKMCYHHIKFVVITEVNWEQFAITAGCVLLDNYAVPL